MNIFLSELTVTATILIGLSSITVTNAVKEIGDICGTYIFNYDYCPDGDSGNYCGSKCITGKLQRCDEGLVCGLETRRAQVDSWEIRCRGCLNDEECGHGMYCDLTDTVGSSFYSASDIADCQVLGLGQFVTKLTKDCRNDIYHPFHYVDDGDCDTVRFYPGTCKEDDDDDSTSCRNESIDIDTKITGSTRIEAERFSFAKDNESRNKGNFDNSGSEKYGTDLKEIDDDDIVVGYIKAGEWLEYLIDAREVNERNYRGLYIRFYYSRGASGSSTIVILTGDEDEKADDKVGSYSFDATGDDWNEYELTGKKDIYIPLPRNTDCFKLRFEFEDGGLDIDYFEVTPTKDKKLLRRA